MRSTASSWLKKFLAAARFHARVPYRKAWPSVAEKISLMPQRRALAFSLTRQRPRNFSRKA